jgi:hypothetical protein
MKKIIFITHLKIACICEVKLKFIRKASEENKQQDIYYYLKHASTCEENISISNIHTHSERITSEKNY